jgi:two-component system phosphate regulon response regulator PhoB
MSENPSILVVDDERDLVELMTVNLEAAGYRVIAAHSGDEGLAKASEHLPNLVILDLMMPGLSGIEIARRLRANPRTTSVPIIMLTARAAEADQIVGLSVGADDYITKPFSFKLLKARVEAILRRASGKSSRDTLTLGAVRLDLNAHEAFVSEEQLKLTPTEYRLLSALIEASGRTLSRAQLVEYAMGPGIAVTDRVIDVHIAAVRRKLGDCADMIRTVRGVGYRAVAITAPPEPTHDLRA